MPTAELLRIQNFALDDPATTNDDGDLLQESQDFRLRGRSLLRKQLEDLRESHDFGIGKKGEKSVGRREILELEQGKHVRWHCGGNLVNDAVRIS